MDTMLFEYLGNIRSGRIPGFRVGYGITHMNPALRADRPLVIYICKATNLAMAVCSLANKPMVGYLMVVLMVMVTMIMEPMAGKVNLSGQREQEIELRLKQLNKQALKSIEVSSDGEIIDCIPIAKQPAFDHPMLKNHMIQSGGQGVP
ncbi:hypothetical protein YC2023_052013 [Brassica napus]